MYDELIKSLRLCTSDKRGHGCASECAYGKKHPLNFWCMDYLLKEAADAIEELSEQLENETEYATALNSYLPQWIPVTERLPDKEKKSYLCRTDGGYHCEVRWTDNKYGLWSGGGGEWGWSIFDIPQYSKVTHWMPLPEPPKESES